MIPLPPSSWSDLVNGTQPCVRFFPPADPQVSVTISRDLDSSITAREVTAVKEWLQSGQPLHSMRDHPFHCVPLLGGTWGLNVTVDTIRQQWGKSLQNIMEDPLNKLGAQGAINGPDQDLLEKWIWPWGQLQAMEHDSYW